MSLKKLTCCFTGHRKMSIAQSKLIRNRLEIEIIKLIKQGVIYFGAGGALGFDTIAAQTVLFLRKHYSEIKLILVLPCKTQARGWKEDDIKIYKDIKTQADKVVYISEDYVDGCMLARNRRLVDYSGYCICYLTKQHSGTAYTVKYAKSKKVNIINLAKTDFSLI